MSARHIPWIGKAGRLLGVLAIAVPTAQAHDAFGPEMVKVCSGDRVFYVAFPSEDPADPGDPTSACHAPCICDRKKPISDEGDSDQT